MQTHRTPSFFSLALMLLAAAACWYLNKDRFNMKFPLKNHDPGLTNALKSTGTVTPDEHPILSAEITGREKELHQSKKTAVVYK